MEKSYHKLIQSTILVILFCFFHLLPIRSHAQIRERQETRAVTPTRPSVSATTVPVEVKWEGSNTVNIVVDGTPYAFRGGQMQLLKLRPNTTLELYVEVPGKKIYAEEFLLIESEGGFLGVQLNGNSAVFTYETPSERRLSERRAAEQQAERLRLAELEREEAAKREDEKEKQPQINRLEMGAEKVLDKYLSAIGGAQQVKAIKTAKISMDANIMGNALTIAFVYDSENGRYGQKLILAGNVIQKTSLANGKGFVSFNGESTELTGAQLAEATLNSYLFPEAIYQEKGYRLTFDGLKDVDGTPAYKVIIADEGGAKLINYYAQETGLKIKNENPVSGDTYYSNYQERNGVLIPMTWILKSPSIPDPLESKVTALELNSPVTFADVN